MKKYSEPEVKVLAFLQIEKNCFDVSDELAEEGGSDEKDFDEFL